MVRTLDARRWIDRIAFGGLLAAGLLASLVGNAFAEEVAELPARPPKRQPRLAR